MTDKTRDDAQLERELAQRTEQLENTTRELEAFVYAVSHDLRAPLRAIDGFLRTVLDEYASGLAPEARQYFDLVRANTHHMSQRIEDLLHYSRLSHQDLIAGEVSMNRIVGDVLAELGREQGSRKIDIRLRHLPDCEGDRVLLKLVWGNLLSNAFKFTRTRHPAVVEIGSCLAENSHPVYFVRDNGIGFDMQYSGKLFKVFQRLHAHEDFEGTGVGLAIVDRIIKRHKGSVWVQAEPATGATFYFTIGHGMPAAQISAA